MNKTMNTMLIGICAIIASIILAMRLPYINEEVAKFSAVFLSALIGASGLTYFRPEPTISKALTKTLWSTAFGIIFSLGIDAYFEIQKMGYKVTLALCCGTFSLLFLQNLLMVMETKFPSFISRLADAGFDRVEILISRKSETKTKPKNKS
jgi:hypothetical protein